MTAGRCGGSDRRGQLALVLGAEAAAGGAALELSALRGHEPMFPFSDLEAAARQLCRVRVRRPRWSTGMAR